MRSTEMGNHWLRGLCIVAAFCFSVGLHSSNSDQPLRGPKRIIFEHFTLEQGLPQSTVNCILQDRKGFLWLGTENGLCRYDGYTFKPYQYDSEDPRSLSNNRVLSICEDRSGSLWIGTAKGLNRFDRLTEHFTLYLHDSEKSASLSCDQVNSIIQGPSGVLWIGTAGGGVNEFHSQTQSFTAYPPPYPQGTSPGNTDHHIVASLLEAEESPVGPGENPSYKLWIGTRDGLYSFDHKTREFKRWNLDPGSSTPLCSNHVVSIYEDHSHTLWIGTKDGRLMQFNPEKQGFISHSYDPNFPPCGADIRVQSIFEDKSSGDLWIGTGGAGLYARERRSGIWYNYRKQRGIATSLSSNDIFSIYQDRGGLIWIGTEDGLNKIDKIKNEFVHWTADPLNKNSLSDNNVWSICKDKQGIIWIGTTKGLNRLDRQTGTFTHYTHDPQKPGTLSHDRIMAICEDHRGVIWVGTKEGGLDAFDRKSGTFTIYKPPTGYEPSPGISRGLKYVSGISIITILEDHQGVLWIGTQDGGLNKFDRDTMTFSHYMPDINNLAKSLSHPFVTSLYEERSGMFWVGTGEGLNVFNRDTETFTHYREEQENPNSISNSNISAIYQDRSGTLWVGTFYGGLNKLSDPKNGTFKHYRQKDGLPNDTVYGILEDEEGNLWLSTVNGLSKFDPIKETFKNFTSDTLQNNEFNGGAWFKGHDGEMFFGGMKGFIAFYPSRIIDNPHSPSMAITDFRVFNKPYLGTSITEEKEVELTYNDTVFSIEFTALDFSTPGKNIYEHKMEKVDPDWVRGNAKQRFVNYTNLSPGKYVFQVMGTNNDGEWSRKPATLRIIVTPPFWLTWWFDALLVISFILSILAIYRLRTKRLREKLAEQKKTQETLKQSHDEMEKARDLAELRHAENEKLLSAISSIFIAVDSNGMIFQWNKPAESFFGIDAVDAIKKPFTEVLRDCFGENGLNEIMTMGLKQDQSSQLIDFSADFKSRGKGIRLVTSTINPILDSSGRHLGFLFLAEDITNRKEEEFMRNLSRKLESLGQLTSGIAHEIKTPLQYISHNAGFVGDSFDEVVDCYESILDTLSHLEKSGNKEIPAKIQELMAKHDMAYILEEVPKASEQIISGVNRVSEIIQTMNEFSHPGRGYKEKADINQILKSTLIIVQSRIKKIADIQLELSETLPPIHCYAGELNQVFINILINASDAIADTGKWGTIRISTAAEENEVVITISDSGCGIPEDNKDHIFTPFFTTKEVGKGTGQGLSLAHSVITEKHKGKLEFTSEKGKGTTFFIHLPIKGEP